MLKDLLIDVDPAPQVASRPTDASPAELRAECAARADLYRLLAGVFAEEPSAPFLASLREPAALAALAEAGARFDEDFTEPDLAALAETLACEYTDLFVASGGFPPVESVRLTGRYQQGPHFDVKEAYRRAGFALGGGRFRTFEDHLGAELSFVAQLLDRCAEAIDRGDLAAYRAMERDIKRFWTLHLGRWVRGYCRLIERAAEHSLYREMARLLAAVADDEIASMRLRVDDVDGGREVVPKSEVQVAFDPDEPVCNACVQGNGTALPPDAIPIAVEARQR
jgi:TorA maturation chaperone TorD